MGKLLQPRNINDRPFRQTIIIATNLNSFANRSKSIRNNLGLPKHSEIYLIQNFE